MVKDYTVKVSSVWFKLLNLSTLIKVNSNRSKHRLWSNMGLMFSVKQWILLRKINHTKTGSAVISYHAIHWFISNAMHPIRANLTHWLAFKSTFKLHFIAACIDFFLSIENVYDESILIPLCQFAAALCNFGALFINDMPITGFRLEWLCAVYIVYSKN